MSFKAISVERRGIGRADEALGRLYFHLLVRGVEHEHDTGRAPLPRGITLIKDLEERGSDKLLLAELEEEVRQASATRFDGQLFVHGFQALDSKGQIMLQVADLFAGSLNRILNAIGSRTSAKDSFADHFLGRLEMPEGPTVEEVAGDITVHVTL